MIFTKRKLLDGRTAICIFGLRLLTCRRKGGDPRSYAVRFPHADVDASASIDENCSIGEYSFVGKDVDMTKCSVGRYCSIAPHCRIGQGEHDVESVSTSAFLADACTYEGLTQKPCAIGNDVWIGNDAIIRRGVTIGNCAVVGANAFVNRDVPDFAIVAGVPAKVIRMRFTAKKRAAIVASRYWDCPPEIAKRIIAKLDEG